MRPVILTSAYLAPVQYYTKLYAAPHVYEERCDHYVKQTYRNRAVIDSPAGRLSLTIPIEHSDCLKPATRDIRISDHGNWRHLHWTALVSTYDNSPYFAYYADDFRPFYERTYKYLIDFNEGLREKICELLSLSVTVQPTAAYADAAALGAADFRETIRPKVDTTQDGAFRPAPYYQVFAARHGFLLNLSIADLLFNMGPESRIVLRRSIAEPSVEDVSPLP